MKTRFHLWIGLLLAAVLLSACTGNHSGGSLTTWVKATPTSSLFQSAAPTAPVTEPIAAETAIPSETEPIVQPTVEKPTPAPTLPAPSPEPPKPIRFAVIGDFGGGGSPERQVAELVDSWNPDFVITVGDNNYPNGSDETIDKNIGRFYQQYIFPYRGEYGPGADQARFFPTLGNHDWNTNQGQPYFDYFDLPGNGRYYNFTWGPVEFFALSSDSREPDGVSRKSIQANWLKEQLAKSQSPWKLVYFHHSPYSSGLHGPVDWMHWPFADWGASAVLSGHDHTYERLNIDGLPYFVNGLGGGSIYDFESISEGSQFRYNDTYGAMLVTANIKQMTFDFYNWKGELIDTYQINK